MSRCVVLLCHAQFVMQLLEDSVICLCFYRAFAIFHSSFAGVCGTEL